MRNKALNSQTIVLTPKKRKSSRQKSTQVQSFQGLDDSEDDNDVDFIPNLEEGSELTVDSNLKSNAKSTPKKRKTKGQIENELDGRTEEHIIKFKSSFDYHMIPKTSRKKAPVFNYFGYITAKGSPLPEAYDALELNCKECYNKGMKFGYKPKTSSTNYMDHLLTHKIDVRNAGVDTGLQNISQMKMNVSSNSHKTQLAGAIAVMCGIGMLPMSIVKNPGFIYFAKYTGAITEEQNLPTSTTIKNYLYKIQKGIKQGIYFNFYL